MTRFSGGWALILFLMLSGCNSKDQLVVYADPWIGTFAQAACDEYERQAPETEIHLRLLSTEVIAQHLHFGNPIDVIMTLDSTLLSEKGLLPSLGQPVPLAPTNLAWVQRVGELNSDIKGAGGTLLEASDRPSRRVAEQWFAFEPHIKPQDSITIANFQSQVQAMLLNAWVLKAFVPDVMARKYPNQLQIQALGPKIPGGFQAYLSPGNNPEAGKGLIQFLQSEKCKGLLADFQNIP